LGDAAALSISAATPLSKAAAQRKRMGRSMPQKSTIGETSPLFLGWWIYVSSNRTSSPLRH
jgi:hypothetical protein